MAVEQSGDSAGRIDVFEVGTGDGERAVVVQTAREDHRVVSGLEFVHSHIDAEFSVADECRTGIGEETVELSGDGLRSLVIGGHSVTQQTIRDGEPVEDVDSAARHLTEDIFRREAAGRTGADDGDPRAFGVRRGRTVAGAGIGSVITLGPGDAVVRSVFCRVPGDRKAEHSAEDPAADPSLSGSVDVESLEGVEEQGQRHFGDFRPCRPVAQAHVHTFAEGQVGFDFTVDVEAMCIVPDIFVSIGREHADAQLRSCGEQLAREFRLACGLPGVHSDGRNPSDGLFEDGRPQCRIGDRGRPLFGILEHGHGCDAEGVARFVETPADRHLDIGPNLFDGHLVTGHGQQPGDQRIVSVGQVVFEHLVERSVDFVEGLPALRPDVRIVGVVAGGVDHRLRPALQIRLVGIVEAEHASQRLTRIRGGEVPDEISVRAFADELRQEVLGDLAVHLRPDSFDVPRLENRLPGASLFVVRGIVSAQHRVSHGPDLQRSFLVCGEDFLIVFGGADGFVAGDEVTVDCGNPVHTAFGPKVFVDRERIVVELGDRHPVGDRDR
jgi:hypothetical protein